MDYIFLEGVSVAAADAERSIIEVASLVAADRKRLLQSSKAGPEQPCVSSGVFGLSKN